MSDSLQPVDCRPLGSVLIHCGFSPLTEQYLPCRTAWLLKTLTFLARRGPNSQHLICTWTLNKAQIHELSVQSNAPGWGVGGICGWQSGESDQQGALGHGFCSLLPNPETTARTTPLRCLNLFTCKPSTPAKSSLENRDHKAILSKEWSICHHLNTKNSS